MRVAGSVLEMSRDNDAVDERILDAAVRLFGDAGIRRTSADDIARASKINRTTLYRRLGTKEHLVEAALIHEIRRISARIDAETARIADPADKLAQIVALTVSLFRDHPIFRQLIAEEDLLTTPSPTAPPSVNVLELATTLLSDHFTRICVGTGKASLAAMPMLAAIVVRLTHSLVVYPDAPPVLRTRAELRRFAYDYLCPMLSATLDR